MSLVVKVTTMVWLSLCHGGIEKILVVSTGLDEPLIKLCEIVLKMSAILSDATRIDAYLSAASISQSIQ